MLLDPQGNKIKPVTMAAEAVIFVSTDGDTWQPVKNYNVPAQLKGLDVMGYMMAGDIIELPDGNLYKAEKLQ